MHIHHTAVVCQTEVHIQPPGTGKTKMIIDAVNLLKVCSVRVQWMFVIECTMQVRFKVPQSLLLCTYTNIAVDKLVDGVVNAGVTRAFACWVPRDNPQLTYPVQPGLQTAATSADGDGTEVR